MEAPRKRTRRGINTRSLIRNPRPTAERAASAGANPRQHSAAKMLPIGPHLSACITCTRLPLWITFYTAGPRPSTVVSCSSAPARGGRGQTPPSPARRRRSPAHSAPQRDLDHLLQGLRILRHIEVRKGNLSLRKKLFRHVAVRSGGSRVDLHLIHGRSPSSFGGPSTSVLSQHLLHCATRGLKSARVLLFAC